MIWNLHYWPRTWIQVGCVAFIAAIIATPLLMRVLRAVGAVDSVSPDKIHQTPVVRGGGIAIFIAFAIAVLWPGYRSYPFQGIMLGAFLCLIVGAVDDLRGGISAVWKLLTLSLATLILSSYGIQLKLFSWYPLDLAFTLLWLVGVTSAFNGIDNMDGAASGVAVIVSAMYLIIAALAFMQAGTETSLSWFGMLAAALIGANLGFLVFNFNPARVFMGDAGSFFLGFTLAALGVMGDWSQNRIISCIIPVLILGVPLFDFGYIILARILSGRTRTIRQVIEHCGTDHLSHRLVWIGFTQRNAVLLIYVLSVAVGVSGVLLKNSTSLLDSVLGLLQGSAFILVVVILMASAERRHALEEREAAIATQNADRRESL